METSYDRVPYARNPFPETHPARMQAVAHLFGLDAPPADACRVLELGCATGGNTVPLAYAFPNSAFVGIDLSARQIDDARAFARNLSLANVDLRAMSIADVTPDLGQFDYVICHGVYSWVPPAIQEHVLRVCRENLSPAGVAFVSYNTYPGSHHRQWVREMMMFHASRFADEAERVREARAFLEAVARWPLSQGNRAGAALQGELELMKGKPDTYLVHEYLEEHNEPLYFHEFAARAASAGLQYLGDARINGTALEEQWPDARRFVASAGDDVIRAEQYADFFRNRSFRRSLLCHANVSLDRAGAAGRVASAHVASPLRPPAERWALAGDAPVRFATAHGQHAVVTDPAVKAALSVAAHAYPAAVPFERLVTEASALLGADVVPRRAHLAGELLRYWMLNLVELYARPPAFATEAGDRPRASAVARLQARSSDLVTNLRHETARLDAPLRALLQATDGTRTVADLATAAAGAGPAEPGMSRRDGTEWTRRALATFGRLALLEA